MYGRHPYHDLDSFEISDAPLTPDAEAVLGEIAVAILDIFESRPRRVMRADWSAVRQIPLMLYVPDQVIDSRERVKPEPSPEALMAHAKRTRLDPRSNPRYRRQFKQRFSSH